MSDGEAKNDKRPDKKEPCPTTSFDSSVLEGGGDIENLDKTAKKFLSYMKWFQ